MPANGGAGGRHSRCHGGIEGIVAADKTAGELSEGGTKEGSEGGPEQRRRRLKLQKVTFCYTLAIFGG